MEESRRSQAPAPLTIPADGPLEKEAQNGKEKSVKKEESVMEEESE